MRDAALFIASQGSGTQPGLLHTIFRTAYQALRSYSNRRAALKLTHLDDHLLADIGLTRGDVREALGLPFTDDIGRELQFRASRNSRRGWNA